MNLVVFLKEKLEFKNIVDNKNLVSEVTFNYINNNLSDNEIKEFKVAEINPFHYVKKAIIPVLSPLAISTLIAWGISLLLPNRILNVCVVFVVFCIILF